MALPELTLPDGTPAFSADSHAIELLPLYADVPKRTGADLRRRVYTVTPRIVEVALQLTAAQMLALHNWYEGPLQVAAQFFSAQVANQGAGLLWWKARFMEPYSADAGEAAASYRVNARLMLFDTGSTTPPYISTFTAATSIALVATAILTVPAQFLADTVIALTAPINFAAASVVQLLALSPRMPEDAWLWHFVDDLAELDLMELAV